MAIEGWRDSRLGAYSHSVEAGIEVRNIKSEQRLKIENKKSCDRWHLELSNECNKYFSLSLCLFKIAML